MACLTRSTIGRKFFMAVSAMFLLVFLIIHLVVNLLSVFNPNAYNVASHFMGYNPFIQFLMQPVLIFCVVFHFVMGFILEIKNSKARPVKYEIANSYASSWISRKMIYSGIFILVFIGLHIIMMWIPEMNYKYIEGNTPDELRYWEELHHKFADIKVVIVYIIFIIALGLHLSHGFQSSFQSIGARSPKYYGCIQTLGKWYSVLIPLGFICIAVFHFLTR